MLTRKDGFAATWLQDVDASSSAMVVEYSQQSRTGEWSPPIGAPAGDAENFQAIESSCIGAFVAFQSESKLHDALLAAWTTGGSWSPFAVLTPSSFSVSPGVTRDVTGCIHLVWNASTATISSAARRRVEPRLTYSFVCPRGTSSPTAR